MKLFRIFAVGLIFAAIVVATAIAPVGSAQYQQVVDYGSAGSAAIDPGQFANLEALIQSYQPALDTLDSLDLGSTDSSTSISMGTTQVTSGLNIMSAAVRQSGDYEYLLSPGVFEFLIAEETGPTSDPPEADVIPTFSGLRVEGGFVIDSDDDDVTDFQVNEDGDIFVSGGFYVDNNNDDKPELNIFTFPGIDASLAYLGELESDQAYVLVENIIGDLMLNAPNTINLWATSGILLKSDEVDIDGDLDVNGDILSTGSIGSFYRRCHTTNSGVTQTSANCFGDHMLTGCSGKSVDNWPIQGTQATLNHCYVYSTSTHKLSACATCFDPTGEHTGDNSQ